MTTFVQFHALTSYPPANLNRDDLNRPKTAVMGGEIRLRISSQSLKRAWRTSEVFSRAVDGHLGTRTKEIGRRVYDRLREKDIDEAQALAVARAIGGQFGKQKLANAEKYETKAVETEQLAHLSPEEVAAVDRLTEHVVATRETPDEETLAGLLTKDHKAVDVALFGRMLASKPDFNVEAAAQVAHAITVHKVAIEDDFFTAVDDLNRKEEDVGAGHMGELGFAAGLFYLYVCIDRDLLVENLQGDEALARSALAALAEAVAKVAPSGKQKSFAARAWASYLLVEKGSQQPRSLSVAFLRPVGTGSDGMLAEAIAALEDVREKLDKTYGPAAEASYRLDATRGEGRFEDLQTFAVAPLGDGAGS